MNTPEPSPLWDEMRRTTQARIGLGRAGDALTTTRPPENNHVSSYAIPLTTTDENFNAPKDIGAPPGYTGAVFVDQGGNTVSIVS